MNLFQIKAGSRRFVFVFKTRVVKIPKFTSWISFVMGVLENLHERYWWCADGYVKNPDTWYSSCSRNLAQIFWADRFGLFVVMERVDPIAPREIEHELLDDSVYKNAVAILEKEYSGLDFLIDLKPSNIGIRPDGRAVLIDYGYFKSMPDWYLGRKVRVREKPMDEESRRQLKLRYGKMLSDSLAKRKDEGGCVVAEHTADAEAVPATAVVLTEEEKAEKRRRTEAREYCRWTGC